MKVKEKPFEFTYTFKRKKNKASCTVSDAPQLPGNIMYRVFAPSEKGKKVFIFYREDKQGSKIFSYPLPAGVDSIAKSIEKGIEDHLFPGRL